MDASIKLYEANRSLIEQMGPLAETSDKIILIDNFCQDTHNGYYMLYGKEIGYFTLFLRSIGTESLGEATINCLENVGPIYSIDLTEPKDAIEIWVKDKEQDLLTCMYLFPYDTGIVRIR